VFFCLSLCYINLPCAAAGATAAEPSLIALVNVSTPLAALVKPSNFKPPDIILAAFSAAAEASSRDLIKHHLNIHLMV
jgi:D-arabinose 5-phosphate isomerase GutQ